MSHARFSPAFLIRRKHWPLRGRTLGNLGNIKRDEMLPQNIFLKILFEIRVLILFNNIVKDIFNKN